MPPRSRSYDLVKHPTQFDPNITDGGLIVPREMDELADLPGVLKNAHGGNKLANYYRDLTPGFDPTRLSEFACHCFFGMRRNVEQVRTRSAVDVAHTKEFAQMIALGRAPKDMNQRQTGFRFSYISLVVSGYQRTMPSDRAKMGSDHLGTLKLLLSLGADVNLGNIVGATPIHLASCILGVPDVLRILLDHPGANPDTRDKYGQTALYDALKTNEVECAEMLLEAGADPTVRDAEGLSPRDLMIPPAASAVLHKYLRQRRGAPPAVFESKICDQCSRSGQDVKLQLCARCHRARYCSRDCQRAAWRAHRPSCTPFDGTSGTGSTSSTTLSLRPFYRHSAHDILRSLGTANSVTRTFSPHDLLRDSVGAGPDKYSKARPGGTKEKSNVSYPRPMIVKIQVPGLGDVPLDQGDMLVYNKRRDFEVYLRPESGREAYLALRRVIKEQGTMGGLKAYFTAELRSKDELAVKTEVIAPQDF